MPVQQKGTDKFLVVAILAAVIALGAIIYGVITSSAGTPKIDPMELPSHQRPAVLDSIQKQDSIRAAEEAAAAAPAAEEPEESECCAMGLDLRANLLRWATLTPDLGLEWHISDRWSLGVGGSWTSWSWNNKQRRYALWEVAPEVRYYMGKARRGYLGLMFKTGAFNYKFSETGRQGDLLGGGLTGGYILPLGKRLSLDFSLGLGYLNADYEKYTVIDGVRVRHGSETRDWWGPVHAGITLKWNLF